MKIKEDFIKDNRRIQIISNNGEPLQFPVEWQPALGADCDMMVIIPDMHMYRSGSHLDNFSFGAEALVSLLEHVSNLKRKFKKERKTLNLCQIGDMYEFEFPGQDGKAVVSEIKLSDNNDYSLILNFFDDLQAIRIYGNHDFTNWNFRGFKFCHNQGKIHIEHGFAGDSFAANPEHPLWDVTMLAFRTVNEIKEIIGNVLSAGGILGKDEFFSPGVTSGEVPRFNMTNENTYLEENGSIKSNYCKLLKNPLNGVNCKVSIIGHTHSPYIDINVDNGNFWYVDAGAWTVGRSDFVVITNEELALCRYKRATEV